MSDPVVLIDKLSSNHDKYIAVVTLNSQGTLNALSQAMVDILLPQFRAWQQDEALACIVLRGAGDKAFCAGGDILNLYKSISEGNGDADRFFEEEYRLDYLIHTFNKPIIAWGNGIVMGGGLGLMAGSSHRVVTERTRLAMPEVGIGLYPDVGGSYFLNKAPGRSGLFVGLTGVSLNAADSIFIGVADSFANHDQWSDLLAQLIAADWVAADAKDIVSDILAILAASAIDEPASSVSEHFDIIQTLTSADNAKQMVADILAYQGEDVWLQKAVKSLRKACPSSVFVFYEQLHRSEGESLKEVFKQELVLSLNFMRIGNFREGVRALLIDKDLSPQFNPASFAEVDQEHIEKHFLPPWSGANPLNNL